MWCGFPPGLHVRSRQAKGASAALLHDLPAGAAEQVQAVAESFERRRQTLELAHVEKSVGVAGALTHSGTR